MDNLDSKLIRRFEEMVYLWFNGSMSTFHDNACMLTSLERAQLIQYAAQVVTSEQAIGLACVLIRNDWRYMEDWVTMEHLDFEAI